MGTYFEAVVELEEGPYPIISNMDESQALSGQLDVTDIRTRAVFAFIRDAPRRVWPESPRLFGAVLDRFPDMQEGAR